MQQTLSRRVSTIEEALERYSASSGRLLVSSSFQTHSIPLLHIVQTLVPGTPVAFLDTGYHFPETLSFRDQVAEQLDLNLVIVGGLEQPTASGLYVRSEDSCCALNKVEPLHEILVDYDVWVSGVRSDQTSARKAFSATMAGPANTERYHPLLAWTSDDVEEYRREFDLPAHPLEELGYGSIGCAPCTSPPAPKSMPRFLASSIDLDRSGRWSSSDKTECGLHLA